MSRTLTPMEAYKMVQKIAEKNGMSISKWAISHGVPKSTVSHWRRRKQNTVLVSTLERLGVQL